MSKYSDPLSKHLIFSNINIDSSKQTSLIRVMTSDGQDLSEYFHIVSFNGLEASIDKITVIGLSLYAAIGVSSNEDQS